MTRAIRVMCLYWGISGWNGLAASHFTDNGAGAFLVQEQQTWFQSFFETTGQETYTAAGLWQRSVMEQAERMTAVGVLGSGREAGPPTVEGSIVWAVSRSEGPIQALAQQRMPHLDAATFPELDAGLSDLPLLVDFRNRAVLRQQRADLSSVSPAFLGETPELPSAALIWSGLGVLGVSRLAHRRATRR